jgi:hypothetical protein
VPLQHTANSSRCPDSPVSLGFHAAARVVARRYRGALRGAGEDAVTNYENRTVRRRGKHGKNSTITTSRALNKPPPMALKTCAAMTTTALRAERWVRATFPPLDVDAKAQPPPSRIMQVTHMRELAIAVLFLATGPASAWAQAGEASSSAAHPVETAGEDVAVLDAPIGHRQPSVNDLPPSLRQKEETGFERSGPPQVREPATHVRQRPGKPDDREQYEAPPTDISPICRGC